MRLKKKKSSVETLKNCPHNKTFPLCARQKHAVKNRDKQAFSKANFKSYYEHEYFYYYNDNYFNYHDDDYDYNDYYYYHNSFYAIYTKK